MEAKLWKTAIVVLVAAVSVHDANANCMLSMRLDLTYNQPLVLSTVTESWYSLDATPAGSLQLRRDESVKLLCPAHPAAPNSFTAFPSYNEVVAKCQQGNKFVVNGRTYTFDQLQCSAPVRPTAQRTGRTCLSSQNELIKVGYPLGNSFVSAYELCFDKDNKGTLYTESEVSPNYAKNDAPLRESAWVNDAAGLTSDSNVDYEYTCPGQAETFHRILGKSYFSQDDKCCFAKAQLVPGADMPYATQQIATYHYLNSVPQWSTCNNRANWVEVEKRIRQLATNLQRPLRVWSGTFRTVQLRTKWLVFTTDMYLHYNSKTDRALPVPLYIWKVVHDPQTRKSLAIIQINKPNMVLSDVDGYKLCPDNCHNVNWMNFLQRQTIGSGYVYCCDLNDFEFSFQFKSSPFPPNSGNILRDDTRTSWP